MKLLSENNKMSLNECKKILNTDGLFYTDEEIIELRDFLYDMADLAMDNIEKEENKKRMQEIEAKNKGNP
jgi:hypothetical protein